MFLKSMITVMIAGLTGRTYGQLLVNEQNFANRMLEAVNGLRNVYEVSQINLVADAALNEKAKELAEKGDLASISSHLKDNPKDFEDFSVNIALIDPPCADRITPKQLVTTFAILAGTNDWPCPSPFEQFGGAEVFWMLPLGKLKRLESNDMTIRGEGFWPFIMEKKGQSVAVGFGKMSHRTVVVLLFNFWKMVALPLPKNFDRLMSPFKFDVVTQKATAGCVSVAPKEAISRLCKTPKTPTGHDKVGELPCDPPAIDAKLQRDYPYLRQCKAYRTYNQNFAKCVGNGLMHGFGSIKRTLTKIILENACPGLIIAQSFFFKNAVESWALYAED